MLSVHNLNFAYKDKQILKNVGFHLERQEIVSVIGPNGCGKTTLSYCLAGIIPHLIHGGYNGDVFINELNVEKSKFEDITSEVGYIFEDPDSQLVMPRVKDEFFFNIANLGVPKNDIYKNITEVIQQFNINELLDMSPQNLSMGQKNKVVLASILLMRPQILIFDEAGSSLDPIEQHVFLKLLQKLRDDGKTIILFTHNLTYAEAISNRIIGMKNGRIVFDRQAKKIDKKDYEELYDMKPEDSNLKKPVVADQKHSEIFSINELKFKYPNNPNQIFSGVSFEIRGGKIVGITGKNGCGKTTLLTLMGGLRKPTSGKILIANRNLHKLRALDRILEVGIVFQNPNHQIFCDTVSEELSFGLRNMGLDENEIYRRIKWVKLFFGFTDLSQDPSILSFGWRKILSFAAIVIMKPEILLVDEPEFGLDLYFQRKIESLLLELSGEHIIVIATHSLNLLQNICDKVVLLNNGKVMCEKDNKDISYIKSYYEKQKVVNNLG